MPKNLADISVFIQMSYPRSETFSSIGGKEFKKDLDRGPDSTGAVFLLVLVKVKPISVKIQINFSEFDHSCVVARQC